MNLPLTDRLLGKIGVKTQAYRLAEAIPMVDEAIAEVSGDLNHIEVTDLERSETRDELSQKLNYLIDIRASLGPQRNIYKNSYEN